MGETILQWLDCVSHCSEFTSLTPAHECQSTSRHHYNQKMLSTSKCPPLGWDYHGRKPPKVRTSRYWPILHSCWIELSELSQTNVPVASTLINIPLECHVFCLLCHIGCDPTTTGLNPLQTLVLRIQSSHLRVTSHLVL